MSREEDDGKVLLLLSRDDLLMQDPRVDSVPVHLLESLGHL